MGKRFKYLIAYVSAVGLVTVLLINFAQAQEPQQVVSVEAVNSEDIQAELDQLLAPIALYPDSVLSHVLVAATYPLELVQANRWRSQHPDLDEQSALNAVEDKDWDPSVKALVPFTDLLTQLTEDLNWLQDIGDAFLADEELVLASIQELRRKAYEHGSLHDNKYVDVVEQDDHIVIQPVDERIVYVPYYDTRVVYGNWWWNNHPPYYWHRPAHYYWHAGLYWSPRVYIRRHVFYSGFTWHNRHVVVNHYPRRYRDDGHRRVRVTEYQRWSHNPHHRRGVRYDRKVAKRYAHESARVQHRVERQPSNPHTRKWSRDGRDPAPIRQHKAKVTQQKMEKMQRKQSHHSNRETKVIDKNRLKGTHRQSNEPKMQSRLQKQKVTPQPPRRQLNTSAPKNVQRSTQPSRPKQTSRPANTYKPKHRTPRPTPPKASRQNRSNK